MTRSVQSTKTRFQELFLARCTALEALCRVAYDAAASPIFVPSFFPPGDTGKGRNPTSHQVDRLTSDWKKRLGHRIEMAQAGHWLVSQASGPRKIVLGKVGGEALVMTHQRRASREWLARGLQNIEREVRALASPERAAALTRAVIDLAHQLDRFLEGWLMEIFAGDRAAVERCLHGQDHTPKTEGFANYFLTLMKLSLLVYAHGRAREGSDHGAAWEHTMIFLTRDGAHEHYKLPEQKTSFPKSVLGVLLIPVLKNRARQKRDRMPWKTNVAELLLRIQASPELWPWTSGDLASLTMAREDTRGHLPGLGEHPELLDYMARISERRESRSAGKPDLASVAALLVSVLVWFKQRRSMATHRSKRAISKLPYAFLAGGIQGWRAENATKVLQAVLATAVEVIEAKEGDSGRLAERCRAIEPHVFALLDTAPTIEEVQAMALESQHVAGGGFASSVALRRLEHLIEHVGLPLDRILSQLDVKARRSMDDDAQARRLARHHDRRRSLHQVYARPPGAREGGAMDRAGVPVCMVASFPSLAEERTSVEPSGAHGRVFGGLEVRHVVALFSMVHQSLREIGFSDMPFVTETSLRSMRQEVWGVHERASSVRERYETDMNALAAAGWFSADGAGSAGPRGQVARVDDERERMVWRKLLKFLDQIAADLMSQRGSSLIVSLERRMLDGLPEEVRRDRVVDQASREDGEAPPRRALEDFGDLDDEGGLPEHGSAIDEEMEARSPFMTRLADDPLLTLVRHVLDETILDPVDARIGETRHLDPEAVKAVSLLVMTDHLETTAPVSEALSPLRRRVLLLEGLIRKLAMTLWLERAEHDPVVGRPRFVRELKALLGWAGRIQAGEPCPPSVPATRRFLDETLPGWFKGIETPEHLELALRELVDVFRSLNKSLGAPDPVARLALVQAVFAQHLGAAYAVGDQRALFGTPLFSLYNDETVAQLESAPPDGVERRIGGRLQAVVGSNGEMRRSADVDAEVKAAFRSWAERADRELDVATCLAWCV